MATKAKILIWGLSFCILWSLYPSLYSRFVMSQINKTTFQNERTISKRSVQSYLLKQGVYVPIENIIEAKDHTNQDFETLQQSCPQNAILWVWVPLKIRLSFFGDFVRSVCFGLNV
jgi:hypothetical protein